MPRHIVAAQLEEEVRQEGHAPPPTQVPAAPPLRLEALGLEVAAADLMTGTGLAMSNEVKSSHRATEVYLLTDTGYKPRQFDSRLLLYRYTHRYVFVSTKR